MSEFTSTIDNNSKPKIKYIPSICYALQSWEHSIACIGCGYVFPCQIDISFMCPSPKFFDHVYGCKKYAKLQLIRECEDCWSFFIDEDLYQGHLNMCPVIAERNLNVYQIQTTLLDYSMDFDGIPGSMPEDDSGDESDLELTENKEAWVIHIPKQSLECQRFREKISCLGCGRSYPGTKVRERIIELDDTEVERDTIIGRRDYYNHCIFKCQKYQELNLISLCLQCNKFFLDPDEFATHKLTSCNFKVVSEAPREKQKCPCCPKMFSSLTGLRRHVVMCHDVSEVGMDELQQLRMDTKIACDVCQRVLFSVGGLRKHMKSHIIPQVPENVGLEIAGPFEKVQNIEATVTSNEMQKKLEASNSSGSGVPAVATDSELPFVCLVCNEGFKDCRRLAAHKRQHSVESRVDIDTTEIASTSGLNASIKATETIQNQCAKQTEDTNLPKNFSDPEMVAVIDFLSPIVVDEKTIMAIEPIGQCSRCSLTFPTSSSLKIHFLDHHFGKEVDCINCDASFTTMSALFEHFMDLHELTARVIARRVTRTKRAKKSTPKSILAEEKLETENKRENHEKTENEDAICNEEKAESSNAEVNLVGRPSPDFKISQLSVTDDNYCLGCNQKFAASTHISRLYHHCIYECEPYAKLGLKRACTTCRGLFMNQQLLEEHKMHFCQVILLD